MNNYYFRTYSIFASEKRNNSASPSESQWEYDDGAKLLTLTSPDGVFTLTGTNGNLSVLIVNATDATITLDNVSITGAGSKDMFHVDANCTLTFVGDNYFSDDYFILFAIRNSICTINGAGSLTLEMSHRRLACSVCNHRQPADRPDRNRETPVCHHHSSRR